MKYLVFLHEIPETVSSFFTDDPVFLDFNGVVINSGEDEEKETKLVDLLYDDGGIKPELKVTNVFEDQRTLVLSEPVTIIHLGMIV